MLLMAAVPHILHLAHALYHTRSLTHLPSHRTRTAKNQHLAGRTSRSPSSRTSSTRRTTLMIRLSWPSRSRAPRTASRRSRRRRTARGSSGRASGCRRSSASSPVRARAHARRSRLALPLSFTAAPRCLVRLTRVAADLMLTFPAAPFSHTIHRSLNQNSTTQTPTPNPRRGVVPLAVARRPCGVHQHRGPRDVRNPPPQRAAAGVCRLPALAPVLQGAPPLGQGRVAGARALLRWCKGVWDGLVPLWLRGAAPRRGEQVQRPVRRVGVDRGRPAQRRGGRRLWRVLRRRRRPV